MNNKNKNYGKWMKLYYKNAFNYKLKVQNRKAYRLPKYLYTKLLFVFMEAEAIHLLNTNCLSKLFNMQQGFKEKGKLLSLH